jgi:hypothetical protein
MKRGRTYLASLNWMAGLFVAGFIVMYGWDGLAWDRFLYDAEAAGGTAWRPGAGREMGFAWLLTPAARSLLVGTIALLTPLLYAMGSWATEGARRDASIPPGDIPSAGRVAASFMQLFGTTLLAAGGAALVVSAASRVIGHHGMGYVIGLPAALLILGVFLRPGGFVHRTAHRFAVVPAGDPATGARLRTRPGLEAGHDL